MPLAVPPKTSLIATEMKAITLSVTNKAWVEVAYETCLTPPSPASMYKYQRSSARFLLTLSTMILISRPPDVPTPSPIHTLDEDLVAFLQRPYEDRGVSGNFVVAAPSASNSETRDRLLAYAYVVYDTLVTRQIPQGPIPSGHAALLLPLLELLHGLHPYNSPVALLLGCVYHSQDLAQRSLQINRHILHHDPANISAMCNLGVIFLHMDIPVQAFEYWWKGLQLSPINWDILDNMLEAFLGFKGLNTTASVLSNTPTNPHALQIHQQSLQMCNFVMGHLPGHPIRMEEVYRAQNIFYLRALLLRSLQETGEWEDLVEGIEIGINTAPALPTSSEFPVETTLDDLLLQAHSIGKLICSITNADTREGSDDLQPSSVPGHKILRSTILLFPEETLRLPLILWASTNGSLPSIAAPVPPENPQDDVRTVLLRISTNAATSRLLRTWGARVQEFSGSQPSSSGDHVAPAAVPCSTFQATQSLVVLAYYLALSLHPTPASYNDLGILLSSIGGQRRISRSPESGTTTETSCRDLSGLYFEAGLEMDPHNACLLTNLGSYWKKERNYEEAIRYYQLALAQNPEFGPPRAYLEQSLREIKPNFEGVRDEPAYQKID